MIMFENSHNLLTYWLFLVVNKWHKIWVQFYLDLISFCILHLNPLLVFSSPSARKNFSTSKKITTHTRIKTSSTIKSSLLFNILFTHCCRWHLMEKEVLTSARMKAWQWQVIWGFLCGHHVNAMAVFVNLFPHCPHYWSQEMYSQKYQSYMTYFLVVHVVVCYNHIWCIFVIEWSDISFW